MSAYIRARTRVFSSSNMIFAFSGAGLFPFSPSKVLCRIPEIDSLSSSVESDMNEALSLDRTFDPALIPSSPIDVSTFQTARSTLSGYMSENPAFHTPVRNFVDRLAKSSERLWARNTILQTSYNALKELTLDRHQDFGGRGECIHGE